MKKLKKLLSIVLAIAMVMSLAVSVGASGEYSIVVTNATAGETYYAYKIFDAVPDSNDPVQSYSYTIDSTNPFCSYIIAATDEATDSLYGYLTLTPISGTSTTYLVEYDSSYGSSFSENFIAVIRAAITAGSISYNGYNTASGDPATATISTLDAGYYYVSTTVGSTVSLGNTPESGYTASIADKNKEPTVEKSVYEGTETTLSGALTDTSNWDTGDADNNYVGDNDAAIGDTVFFQTKIDNVYGQTSLILKDTLSDGLTLDTTAGAITVTLYYGSGPSSYDLSSTDDYELDTSTNGQFTIDFARLLAGAGTAGSTYETYVDSTSYIIVTYSAEVNSSATIYSTGSNDNETYVTYGSNSESERDKTKTYVYEINLYKYTGGTNTGTSLSGEQSLAGAQFIVLNADKDKVAVFTVANGVYTFEKWIDLSDMDTYSTQGTESITLTSVTGSVLNIEGLDAETLYYIRETVAPTGYNIATDDFPFYIVGSDDSTNTQGDVYKSSDKSSVADNLATLTLTNVSGTTAVAIENNSGTGLPETGGIGVTIFYVVGGILILAAAGVIVINRKKIKK